MEEQAFIDICDELGCAYDNESPLIAIDNLKHRAGKSLSDYSDAEIRAELHRRTMEFLVGVTVPHQRT